MQAAISKAKRTDKKEKSSQDSIPYLLMRQDGICQVTRNHFTKTIQFRDINYQLSDNEDKQAIFDSWCDFLNYFDSSVSFQLSFINLTGLRGAALRTIPVRTDQFESIQRELSGVIQNQQEKGNKPCKRIWRKPTTSRRRQKRRLVSPGPMNRNCRIRPHG